MADVRAAPGALAVVAGTGTSADRARITAGLSGDDRVAAVPHEDQAVGGQRFESCPDDAGSDALRGAQFGDRWQLIAGARRPDWMASASIIGDLLRGRAAVAGVDHQRRDVAVLGERPAGAGQVAAALQPRVQLVEDGAADLPHLHGARGRA